MAPCRLSTGSERGDQVGVDEGRRQSWSALDRTCNRPRAYGVRSSWSRGTRRPPPKWRAVANEGFSRGVPDLGRCRRRRARIDTPAGVVDADGARGVARGGLRIIGQCRPDADRHSCRRPRGVDLHSRLGLGDVGGPPWRPDVAQRHTSRDLHRPAVVAVDAAPCGAKLSTVQSVPIQTRRRHPVPEPTRVMGCPGYQRRSSETGLDAAFISDFPSRR